MSSTEPSENFQVMNEPEHMIVLPSYFEAPDKWDPYRELRENGGNKKRVLEAKAAELETEIVLLDQAQDVIGDKYPGLKAVIADRRAALVKAFGRARGWNGHLLDPAAEIIAGTEIATIFKHGGNSREGQLLVKAIGDSESREKLWGVRLAILGTEEVLDGRSSESISSLSVNRGTEPAILSKQVKRTGIFGSTSVVGVRADDQHQDLVVHVTDNDERVEVKGPLEPGTKISARNPGWLWKGRFDVKTPDSIQVGGEVAKYIDDFHKVMTALSNPGSHERRAENFARMHR